MNKQICRTIVRRSLHAICIVAALALFNATIASWLVWKHYDAIVRSVGRSDWPFLSGSRRLVLEKLKSEGGAGEGYQMIIAKNGGRSTIEIAIPGQEFSPIRFWNNNEIFHLASLSKERHFIAEVSETTEIQSAFQEAAQHLPKLGLFKRFLASLVLHPILTGARWGENGLQWRVRTSNGVVWLGQDPIPYQADLSIGEWRLRIREDAGTETAPAIPSVQVPGKDLTTSIAELIRIGTGMAFSSRPKVDCVRYSGAGWLAVRKGHVQMFLEGSSYEVGYQHGRLDPDGVRRVCQRLVFGVGLLYSFKTGEWFPKAARKLVERQRPFIAPDYFEEMKGLADGAGLPLDLIQAANIFPEFFHCSGAALMGNATEGGELLHARVLDYMVGIGLQDQAAVIAISRQGVNRFVTVGYLGFIGSVTGMNEKQVAIGEMGGDGSGEWDGVPMSLLIRQSLESCNTLEEVEALMRESPRTCEYFYLISDGKGPKALGVAATPKMFETFGPGVWHERLGMPVEDTVLISGPGRYEKLVERVREGYGKITRDELIEIIKRPVAMKSNLHNVVFQPQSLRLSVADAAWNGMACDQPYRTYSWDTLFSAKPSH